MMSKLQLRQQVHNKYYNKNTINQTMSVPQLGRWAENKYDNEHQKIGRGAQNKLEGGQTTTMTRCPYITIWTMISAKL